jgi:hypothetical protein
MGKNECGQGGFFSGDFLSLIIVLAIVVVFLTCICGDECK